MKKPTTFWSYWDLKKNPFGNIETANDVFDSNETTRVMDHLAEAIEEGGIYSITGDRGIGKTTALHEIIQYLKGDEKRFTYSLLQSMDMKLVGMTTIHSALIKDLAGETPCGFSEYRSRQVRRILGGLSMNKKRAILLIDEAQGMRFDTIESLKMLTEMRWAQQTKCMITIMLFGQPILDMHLAQDDGLRLRVTPLVMKGLTSDEVLQYIDLRCRVAGGNKEDIFSPEFLTYIAEHQHSPLHINGICSQCMRAARNAGEKIITLEMLYSCESIRSPKTILRDNGITVLNFSKRTGIPLEVAKNLISGKGNTANDLQKEKFKNGLDEIVNPSDHMNYDQKEAI